MMELDQVQDYLRAGLSVLPAWREGEQKRVALRAWKPYQERLPTDAEVRGWFANNHQALCLVCGAVSGNLEMIDFDLGGEAFEPWCALVREAAPGLLERLVIEATPPAVGSSSIAARARSAETSNSPSGSWSRPTAIPSPSSARRSSPGAMRKGRGRSC